jgi:hypothetical protein
MISINEDTAADPALWEVKPKLGRALSLWLPNKLSCMFKALCSKLLEKHMEGCKQNAKATFVQGFDGLPGCTICPEKESKWSSKEKAMM